MMDTVGDGITQATILQASETELWQQLAAAAKSYDWPAMLVLLSRHPLELGA